MNVPTAPVLAKLFSQLTGRSVRFTLDSSSRFVGKKVMYGTYTLPPTDDLLVVSSDRLVIGQLGGSLLGLPTDSIAGRLDQYQSDEMLCDAMHEIMNIASSPISPDRRAVLKAVSSDAGQLEFRARSILDSSRPVSFQVTIDEVASGLFAVFA